LTSVASTHAVFRRQLLLVDALESAGDFARARSIVSVLVNTARPGDDRAEALWRRALCFGNERTLHDAIDDIHAALRELNWTPETVSDVAVEAVPLAVSMLLEYASILGGNHGKGAAACQ
jgi:hypothetical protein